MKLRPKTLLLWWTIFSNPIAIAVEKGKHCYSDGEVVKLAKAITLYKKCRVEVSEKDILINSKLAKFDAGPAFWQEPSFVVGGIVVGFGLGFAVGWYLKAKANG